MTPVLFMGAARAEVEHASDVYETRCPGLGQMFEDAVAASAREIGANPTRFPRTGRFGCRRHEIERFPYGVVYRIEPTFIRVVAVAHHKRKPGYYNARI